MSDEESPDHWYPVCGWTMGTLPECGCLVHLRYLATPISPNEDVLTIPLALTAEQARDLSKHLAWLADEAENRIDPMPRAKQ
ncbi:hypothetical protein KXR53_23150 [Inquilinus limosus]|uniref:hypothetical protein n=1 Tax=Inquilinus limosus TaxID=171674 RepID=UPI003F15622F